MTVADAQGSRVVTAFDIPGTDARLTGAELFAEMDDLEAKANPIEARWRLTSILRA